MDALLHLLSSIQSTRFATVASSTILVYDHLVTLDQEIDLIWKRDWSLLKCVFIFHRYLGVVCVMIALFVTLSSHVSESMYMDGVQLGNIGLTHRTVDRPGAFWFPWEMWVYTVVVLTSELVLLLWIFVLYNKSVGILAITAVLFAGETIAVVTILAKSFARLQIVATLDSVDYCSLKETPPFFYWYWLPVLVYNTAILALFIVKATDSFRISYMPQVNLLHDVYRTSFVHFLGIFVAYFLCCVFWIAADFSLGQIPVGFAFALSITNSTRLLINIRHAYYSREDVDLDRPTTPAIYANQTPREEWLFELRELRLSRK